MSNARIDRVWDIVKREWGRKYLWLVLTVTIGIAIIIGAHNYWLLYYACEFYYMRYGAIYR